MDRVRVATWNVRHCWGLDDRIDVDRVIEICSSFDADVIALQELDNGLERSGHIDQAAAIAAGLDLKLFWVPAIQRGDASYGNALLSRTELGSTEILTLPPEEGREPRVAGVGRLDDAGDGDDDPVWVAVTHLQHQRRGDPKPGHAIEQARGLTATLAERSGSQIVLGDLNVSPDEALEAVTANGFERVDAPPTFPVKRPRRLIDWILVRGVSWSPATTVDTQASDHLPLIADITW
jgi:endonuclease/exonuclease/phosphatase family metal-dependent hydrolase